MVVAAVQVVVVTAMVMEMVVVAAVEMVVVVAVEMVTAVVAVVMGAAMLLSGHPRVHFTRWSTIYPSTAHRVCGETAPKASGQLRMLCKCVRVYLVPSKPKMTEILPKKRKHIVKKII